jgi:hypothetical protein
MTSGQMRRPAPSSFMPPTADLPEMAAQGDVERLRREQWPRRGRFLLWRGGFPVLAIG